MFERSQVAENSLAWVRCQRYCFSLHRENNGGLEVFWCHDNSGTEEGERFALWGQKKIGEFFPSQQQQVVNVCLGPRLGKFLHLKVGLQKWTDQLCMDQMGYGKQPVAWLYIGFQGWFAGAWYDGPIVSGNPLVSGYWPIGSSVKAASWNFLMDKDNAKLRITSAGDLSRSFQLAMRSGLQVSATVLNIISLNSFDLKEILVLVYLRKAFPTSPLLVTDFPDKVPLRPAWMRLCQNLGLYCGKTKPPSHLCRRSICIENLKQILTTDTCLSLSKEICQLSKVVPENLLASACRALS